MNLFSTTITLISLALITACTQTAGKQIEPVSDTIVSDQYTCSDGEQINVLSTPTEANLNIIEVRRAGQTLAMRRVPAASGNKFSGGGSTWWMKGDEASFIIGDETPINCQKVSLDSDKMDIINDAHKDSLKI